MPVLQYALQTAGQVLIDHGYPPEAAFIDLYLSGELEDLLHRAGREGLFPALRTMSLTSQYGLFSRLERFQDNRLATLMGLTLEDHPQRHLCARLGPGSSRMAFPVCCVCCANTPRWNCGNWNRKRSTCCTRNGSGTRALRRPAARLNLQLESNGLTGHTVGLARPVRWAGMKKGATR